MPCIHISIKKKTENLTVSVGVLKIRQSVFDFLTLESKRIDGFFNG